MLKEAYDKGALAACIEAGLVKEAGKVTEIAKSLGRTLKTKAKGIGGELRNAAHGVSQAKGEFQRYMADKKLWEAAKPYLAAGGVGAGALGAGYGGYKLLQSLFPDASKARFYSPFGGGD